MAKLAINILIEKRKNLEKDPKIFSILSFLFHAFLLVMLFLNASYSRYKEATKPRVYRVSIATLPSLSTGKAKATTTKKSGIEKTQIKKPEKKKTKAKGINTKLKKKTKKQKTKITKKPRTEKKPVSKTGQSSGQGIKKGFSQNSSSIMNLDTTSFDYAYYLAIVRDKIGDNWVRTYTGSGKVKVYFKIMRSGEIWDAKVEVSSGNPGLDRLALEAVLKSNPLPPLPEGFRENYIGIHIWFNYEE